MIGGWIDQATAIRFADVAAHLGIAHVRGRTVAPCPNPTCGATRRGSGDARGAVDLSERDGRDVWHCKRCNVGGDAFAAVCLVVANGKFTTLHADDKARVREWFADRGWCDPVEGYVRPREVPAPKAKRIADDVVRPPTEYPPQDEVMRLWSLCGRLGRDVDATDPDPGYYLRDRGLDAHRLSTELDVVRATPRMQSWPSWWPGWLEGGDGPQWPMYRLMILAYDAMGEVRSVHARRVLRYRVQTIGGDVFADPRCGGCGRGLDRHANPWRIVEKCAGCSWLPKPKTLWPARCSSERLLFADPLGVGVLKRAPNMPTNVLIVEGLTDLLRGAMVASAVPCAVIGFTSGGAQALADVRWQTGTSLGVATDDDKAGDAYAEQVAEAVRPLGVKLRRIKWASLVGQGAGR